MQRNLHSYIDLLSTDHIETTDTPRIAIVTSAGDTCDMPKVLISPLPIFFNSMT